MNKDDFEKILFPLNENDYGKKYKSDIMTIYIKYIQTVENISNRRQSANSFFLTINTAIIAIVSVFNSLSNKYSFFITSFAVGICGIIICYNWNRLIRSYAGMNAGKFIVIKKIEKKLPLSVFDAEWIALGEGDDPSKYLPFTKIERRTPYVFMFLYLIMIIVSIVTLFM